jgi:hypothetical protein
LKDWHLIVIVASGPAMSLADVAVQAEELPTAPRGQFVPHALDSGLRGNETTETRVVFSTLVTTPDAAWTRLYFSDLALARDSAIRLTSLQDGETQILDAVAAQMWGNSSAYFNGDSVLVELLAAPRSAGNRVTMGQVAVEFDGGVPQAVGGASECGICGVDDRVPSNQKWAARLMPAGCTASVYNSCSCLVSAGHCMSSGMVVQFNVPNSQSNCSLVNPPVADQFPITAFQYSYVDIGNDWSVLKAGTNSQGQQPYQRYGVARPIAASPPVVGEMIGLWGYGMDTNCINNQRQQYAGGNVNVVAPTYTLFSADLRAGNSGTAVVRNGEIVGVVTNCMVGCPNVATRINVAAFAAARNNLCPCSATCEGDITADGIVGVDDLLVIVDHWGACPSGTTPPCPGDIAAISGIVDVNDLLTMVNAWGPCP